MRNKSTYSAAKVIQSRRIIELQQKAAGIETKRNVNLSVKDFCEQYINQKTNITDKYRDRLALVVTLFDHYKPGLLLKDVDETILRGFVSFLQGLDCRQYDRSVDPIRGACRQPTPESLVDDVLTMRKAGATQKFISESLGMPRSTVNTIIHKNSKPRTQRKLSATSVTRYFEVMLSFISKASKQGLIPMNPVDKIEPSDRPKAGESVRAYLTVEELALLKDTPCKYESVKHMFLFCCFTGLRWSDVKKVTWKMVVERKVIMTMQKTGGVVVVPLSQNALNVLPERGESLPHDLVFTGYPCLPTTDLEIHRWVRNAGIDKNISFHCSRHTFATSLLTYGVDLYTVSKLLGHKNIQVTQVYAKIVDQKKSDAVNMIPEIL